MSDSGRNPSRLRPPAANGGAASGPMGRSASVVSLVPAGPDARGATVFKVVANGKEKKG